VAQSARRSETRRSLVQVLGLDGERMRWEALLILMLAGWLSGVFVELVLALLRGGGLAALMPWLILAGHSVLQAVLLGLALRWLRRDLRAAMLAGLVMGMAWPMLMGLVQFGQVFWSLWLALAQVSACFWLVAGLALGLKLFKVNAPALVIGGALGKALHLATMGLSSGLGLVPYADMYWAGASGAQGVLASGADVWPQLLAGGLFGLVLWGAMRLLPASRPA